MPECPHCGAQIVSKKDVRFRRITTSGTIAVTGHDSGDIIVVSCATCDKILGIE